MSLTVTRRITGALAASAVLASGLWATACDKKNVDPAVEAGGAAYREVAADVDEATARVSRVTFLTGDASVRSFGADDWDQVDLNEPVLEGDELYVPDGGQCELGLGGNHYARVGEGAYVTMSRLDPGWTQVELAEGTMTLALADYSDEHFEVNSPGAAVIPRAGGSYRVDVLPDGTTRVRVLRGSAEVTTPGGTAVLGPGDTVDLGPNTQGIATAYAGYPADDWDYWSDERDVYYNDLYVQEVPQPVRTLYGREDIFGVADLIAYGVWRALDGRDDRYVWVPNTALAADWSPYQDGYWDYVPAVGYTWVSNEPWGWAPYHYGRWDYVDQVGWAWAPYHDDRAVTVAWQDPYRWRPALVYMWQPQGRDALAWVPLAPGEPYIPYSATVFGDVPDPSYVDFRPRLLAAQRDVLWVDYGQLGRQVAPRRVRAAEALAWTNGDVNGVRFAKLPVRDKFLAKGKDLPPGLRPRDDLRRRAVVVDPRSVDQLAKAERRAEKVARVAGKADLKRDRQIVKADRKAVQVERRQADRAMAGQGDARFEKRARKVERRGKGISPQDTGMPAYNPGRGAAARAEKAQRVDRPAAGVGAADRPGKGARKAERGPAVQSYGGGAAANFGGGGKGNGGGRKAVSAPVYGGQAVKNGGGGGKAFRQAGGGGAVMKQSGGPAATKQGGGGGKGRGGKNH